MIFIFKLLSVVTYINVVLLKALWFLVLILLAAAFFQKYAGFVFPQFVMFFVSVLGETNRLPFDLPEAEAELVGGYNLEHGAASLAILPVAEYGYLLLVSSLVTAPFVDSCGPFAAVMCLIEMLVNFKNFDYHDIYFVVELQLFFESTHTWGGIFQNKAEFLYSCLQGGHYYAFFVVSFFFCFVLQWNWCYFQLLFGFH